jgi:hypothetical protein
MNSREKGKRGERQWRDELRANGYAARRGQQFSGSPDSPDVICDGLPWAHFEVKLVERLDLYAAVDQARRDCMGESREQKAESRNLEGSARGKVPFVAHRRNFWPWLVTMDAERFYRLLKQDLTGQWAERMAAGAPEAALGAFAWMHCEFREGKRLNIHDAMAEAARESRKQKSESRNEGNHLTPTLSPRGGEGGRTQRVPIIAHRRPGGQWLITMTADSFFDFLRGVLPPEGKKQTK